MANAVEQALKRAAENPEFKQAQEALKQSGVSLAVNNVDRAISHDKTSNVNAVEAALSRTSEKDRQVIDAAKSHITLVKDADQVTSQQTPSNARVNTSEKQLDATHAANIESVQRGPGNNYQQQNEVGKALARGPHQPQQQPELQQQKER